MDPITAIAASGLRARMESLDLLANNIANASTGGYKADREFYSLYAAPEALDADSASTMPLIERHWTDLSQGEIRNTGNHFDVALDGKGFLAVKGPSGSLYTRNGSLRLSVDGTLVTSEGYTVRGTGGAPITLQSGRPIEIAKDGTIRQDGAIAGQFEIIEFTGAAGLVKQGSNYFRVTDPAAIARGPVATTVEQGKLEGSNSGTAESSVRLISVMRQFEMLQKAVALGGEMNRQAIEQVAKVG